MSPPYDKKPLALVGRSPPSDDATLDVDDERQAFHGARWKAQRGAKYQRDLLKRGTARADLATGHRAAHHRTRVQAGRLRDTTLASLPPWNGDKLEDTRGRSIPGRRKDKTPRSPVILSQSVPSAQSWPPGKDSATGLFDPLDAENMDPNLALDSPLPISSSAPDSSYLSRSYENKREARTMTLFESAVFFNEAGDMLNRDGLHEYGKSPELGPQSRRKPKRRVGRHKTEKKKVETGDRLSSDEVVVELMSELLPDMDVTKELNMLFLSGSRHHGAVFDFDDEIGTTSSSSKDATQSCKLLRVDVAKFQASLASLVFGKYGSADIELPLVGTPSLELVHTFITDKWVVKTIMETVVRDVIAQNDAFTVVLAVFRAIPMLRLDIAKGIVSASLAIYEYQGIPQVQTSSNTAPPPCVSMKGLISLLDGILAVLELDAVERMDSSLAEHPSQSDESLDELCDCVLDAIKLLVRSAPGRNLSSNDANQLEKFDEGSDSVEATTYGAIGDVLYRLTAFSPLHGQSFLSWMLRKWPQRSIPLQIFFTRFVAGMLVHCTMQGIFLSREVISLAFERIVNSINSPHFLVAKEAVSVCGNLALVEMFLSRDQIRREQVSEALHRNTTRHWNDRIRQLSDEYFDLLLDFA